MSPLIPVTLTQTVLEIASSSMTMEVAATTATVERSPLVLHSGPPQLVSDLVEGLGRGIPLDRPADMLRLAEEVLAQQEGYPENWADELGGIFSQLDD